jgi:hypothetical protein
MKIKEPGFYKEQNGGKAEVLGIRADYAFGVTSFGTAARWHIANGERTNNLGVGENADLIASWPDSEGYWVNRYDDGLSANYRSAAIARGAASKTAREVLATHCLRLIDGKLVDVTDGEPS